VGIYLLLRLLNFESEQCLSMMEEMRPRMREEFVLRTSRRHLHSKAKCIFADRRFKDAVKLSIEHLYEIPASLVQHGHSADSARPRRCISQARPRD
jgi:hypothetical protein